MERICFLNSSAVLWMLPYILACLTSPIVGSNIDQSALLSLKKSITSDPNQLIAKNWSTDAPVCSWIGVTCNLRHHRVKKLDLAKMALVGRIPPQLGNLSFLVSLNMSVNSFYGPLPPVLANLHRLKVMNFSFNLLSGTVPLTILKIPTLQKLTIRKNNMSGNLPEDICHYAPKLWGLDLANNNITGRIPSNISGCMELRWLALEENKLTGPIPRELGNLTLLKVLSLGNNNLEGFIPPELGYISGLEFLNLEANSFSGSIPTTLFNISTIKTLALTQNHLPGRLPSFIGNGMPNLENLHLAYNKLEGAIPDSIANCSNLILLDLSANAFNGLIPNTLGNLRILQGLYLAGNNLEADQEVSFITSLTRCRYLRVFSFGSNPLNVILPASIGNLSNLEMLEAGTSGFKGEIPKQTSNLSNLIYLDFSYNDFMGSIPTEFGGLHQLQGLLLFSSKIGGSIPTSLCNLQNLNALYLDSNQIVGSLPECLGNFSSLRELSIADNKLTSSIPTSLWNLKGILKINLTSNHLNGSLPPDVASLHDVVSLDFSLNQFSGYIPSTIGQLPNLIELSLADNKFEGPIPESMGKLISLETLDLSNNSLTGIIPKSLEALQNLWYFNVSFNRLSGEIPSGGPFINFTYLSFLSNEGICGRPRFHVPSCLGSSHRSSKKKVLLAVLIPIATLLAAVTLVVMLVLLRYQRREVGAKADPLPDVKPERIPYQELQRATDGFNDRNLLGRGSFGSVFKGSFVDGTLVAVKVFELQLEGAFKSFETECSVLRSLRHRNLTKVISCCSNLDFKALILEYMPSGSLEKWIHSDGHFLDIVQRLNIMTDVACAIEYLHHGYSIPVVHCDLKPSNVLLDQEMVAHVSDFGIAKLLGEEETMRHTTTVATFGYMAPEYGAEGLVSTSCDVYSYGIMLMETFTSRRPTDEMFSEDFNLRSWVANSFPRAIDQVIDANLVSPNENNLSKKLNAILSILEIAMNCSAESPGNRPSMTDIVASLKKIKKSRFSY